MPTATPKYLYEEIFSDLNSKADAFDAIAKHFYEGNFGRMSKADIETLMFHLYIEQILKRDDEDYTAYSDFRLSKELGITQSRVSGLKVKKQLQYPHDYQWQESFARVSKKARYIDGKIKIQIPDINLYYEIRNAIEEMGGYVETSLTPKLLQIDPEWFFDLLVVVSENEQRENLKREYREFFREKCRDKNYLDKQPVGSQFANIGKDIAIELLKTVVTSQGSIAFVGEIANNVLCAMSKALSNQ